jgi:hypothetical protein
MNGVAEAKIATNLGFESLETLSRQLHQDDYPLCPVCGAASVKGGHCEQQKNLRQRKPERELARALSCHPPKKPYLYLERHLTCYMKWLVTWRTEKVYLFE